MRPPSASNAPMPDERDKQTPPSGDDTQRHAALRRVESRLVLPLAAAGFAAVLVLAWYGVRVTGAHMDKDGRLTAREAAYLERGGGLIGLSLEEALPLLDGTIVREQTTAGEMPAIAIADVSGARMVMILTDGRISRVERVGLP